MVWTKFREHSEFPKRWYFGWICHAYFSNFISNRLWNLGLLQKKKVEFPVNSWCIGSALLTGGIGLLPGATVLMFAIKEAALPAILGVMTIITLKTRKPLVKLFLYNPDVINVELVDQALEARGTVKEFNQLLRKCTLFIALSFLLSATLNYFLSRAIVVTEPYKDKLAFNNEVGTMMGWSFPIISIPCMVVSGYAFWILIKGIKKLAGFSLEEILNQQASR